jgi:hypothetical protein
MGKGTRLLRGPKRKPEKRALFALLITLGFEPFFSFCELAT